MSSERPQLNLLCNASGFLLQADGSPINSWRAIHMSQRIGVSIAGGSDATFQRLHRDAYTSKLFMDTGRRYIMKASKPHMVAMKRELCVDSYLRQRGIHWIPRVLCADNPYDPKGFIMTHAGEQVTSANMPRDYRKQFLRIADEMAASLVTHNDLKYEVRDLVNFTTPSDPTRRVWMYKFLEVFVKHGRLGLIDFNMAQINKSYYCKDEYGEVLETRAPKKSHRKSMEHRQPDAHAVQLVAERGTRVGRGWARACRTRGGACE